MDKKCGGLDYYMIKGVSIRVYCYECSNRDCEKCCELEDHDKICGSCNELMDKCKCDDIRCKSQVVHKNLHYATLRNELIRIAWHPDRY